MIYILMEVILYDYDSELNKPVFASTSLEVVEKKHTELIAYYTKYKNLYDRWIADIQKINKENPPPVWPDTNKLPRRPLVWREENWQDPYSYEHRQRSFDHSKMIAAKTDQLKLEYIEFYKEAEPDIIDLMERIYSFAKIPSYTIEEVESD